MATGIIDLGAIGFVDKGTYGAAIKYELFNFVVTEDSCYLSLKDENTGHPVTDTIWWRCIANGKQATAATLKALAAEKEASTQASNANSAAVRAGSAALEAEKQARETSDVKDCALITINDVVKMLVEGNRQIASMKAAELSLMSQALLAPSRMDLKFLKRITIGNPVKQIIEAALFPSYVLQNVLFLPAGGDAVTVNPAGELTINKVGKSSFHVIPTHNTSLYRTIDIEVTNPAFRKVGSNIRLLSGGKIRKV